MNKPEEYLSLNTYQGKDAKDVLHKFLSQLTWGPQEKVIDIGSGPGNVTSGILLPALPKDASVVGLDTSVEMVTFANRRYGSDRLSFKQVDVSTNFIPAGGWQRESYDKIFSFYCLNFIHDQVQTARNMYYLLKKGGCITLLFCGSHPFYEVYEILASNPKWAPYITNLQDIVAIYQHVEDASHIYAKILRDAGFNIKTCNSEIFTYQFPTMKDLIMMYAACNPYSDGIPKSLHQEYLDAVEKIMIDKKMVKINETGAAILHYKNIVAFAQK